LKAIEFEDLAEGIQDIFTLADGLWSEIAGALGEGGFGTHIKSC